MPWTWSKIDHLGLAFYVKREARALLSLNINILDSLQQPSGILYIVRSIYDALLAEGVQYVQEPGLADGPTQEIRSPSEILERWKEGTCLDLALLFCGICLGCDLLPVLIVLDGHALVAVSLNHNLKQYRDWGRKEWKLFENALVNQDMDEKISELIASEAYLVVECTGFAQSQSLIPPSPEGISRRADGTMTFDRANEAGKEHFLRLNQRAFKFAIDIATAHHFWRINPLADSEDENRPSHSHSAQLKQTHSNPLPYLLDRSDQEKALMKAVLEHRANSPKRPLICIIHGDEREYHAAFLERLERVSLPKILEFWYPEEVEHIPPLRKRMELSLRSITDKGWDDTFWQDLSYAITGDRTVSRADIIDQISRHKVAVMIDTPLLAEEMDGVAMDRLNLFFEFWNKWENLPEKLLLIVCLSLKYQGRCEARRRWYQIRRPEGLNDRLRHYVGKLDFSKYGDLHGVRLPELQAITRKDAEAAVNHKLVSLRYDLTELDVIRIYNQPNLCTPEGHIPMCTLLEQFFETLRSRKP